MRIAYFINAYPKVSHSFIRREILALEQQGFEIQRLALRGWDGELPDAEDRSERSRTQYILRHGLPGLLPDLIGTLVRHPLRFISALGLAIHMSRKSGPSLLHHLAYLAEACRVLTLVKRGGAAWLHAHFGTNSAEVAMLTHALGGPRFSFTVHGPEEFQRPLGLDVKIRHAAFVVAISSFGRSQLYMLSSPSDWGKIKVVHCGLEKGFYDGVGLPVPDIRQLVCVGRLCEAKGQILLIEAAALLVSRGVQFKLVLAGDGPLRPEIEQAVARHGLADHIHITGWISSDQVRSSILASRAVVLPSFAEGLPVVIMEAMALRRPVLTTYVAGIPELVIHGRNGWLFPAGSVEDLAETMQQCLETASATLKQYGDAGFARVTERHAIEIEASKLGDFFIQGSTLQIEA